MLGPAQQAFDACPSRRQPCPISCHCLSSLTLSSVALSGLCASTLLQMLFHWTGTCHTANLLHAHTHLNLAHPCPASEPQQPLISSLTTLSRPLVLASYPTAVAGVRLALAGRTLPPSIRGPRPTPAGGQHEALGVSSFCVLQPPLSSLTDFFSKLISGCTATFILNSVYLYKTAVLGHIVRGLSRGCWALETSLYNSVSVMSLSALGWGPGGMPSQKGGAVG